MVAENSPNSRAKTTHPRPNAHGSGSRHPHVPKVASYRRESDALQRTHMPLSVVSPLGGWSVRGS